MYQLYLNQKVKVIKNNKDTLLEGENSDTIWNVMLEAI